MGAGCVGGQEREWREYLLDELRAFGINADRWATAAPDKGKWRKTAEQKRNFSWQNGSPQKSLGWTMACSSMPERDGKDQGKDSTKQGCSCWFVRHN